ncbi:class II aldolase and Adducin N-terminal domain-containing protein [Halenospora varia]|nr:class II aldolase and Adducin N-terminal domain-containing protein [Halenospora varia]
MVAANLTQLFGTLITASHILHFHGVLDAYGHLSVRNPNNASTFFMSRNEAPALMASASDIVEYYISDASPVEPNAPRGFIERYIHSEIFKRFSAINSVVHSHSPPVIPFSISGVPMKPSIHLAGFLGEEVPVFNIADHYNATDSQDLLVRTIPLGAALAAEFSNTNSLQAEPDHLVVLMRSHGFTTCADNIKLAVMQAIYTQTDDTVQSTALTIRNAYLGSKNKGDGVVYLTAQQARDSWAIDAGTVERPWDLWVHEVESSDLYINMLDPNQTTPAAPNFVS